MSRNQSEEKEKQVGFTPISYMYKPIEKTGVSKAIFGTLKTEQNQHQNNHSSQMLNKLHESKRFQSSVNRNISFTPSNFKQSHYIKEHSNRQGSRQQDQQKAKQVKIQQNSKLYQRIQFLQHCMNEYKQQALSMYSKLTERQRFYNQYKQKYDIQLRELRSHIGGLQKQIQGQSKLIQQCHQKYDIEVKQHELCLKVIDDQKTLIEDMNMQINSLQRAVNSTRQVSVGLIKENENIKAQNIIQREKYELLFQDYGQLSFRYEKEMREMYDENRVLIRKFDEIDMELKIYQKDKEIQSLLIYQDNIHKRQREMMNFQQSSSSPPSVKFVANTNLSPYEYIPRRLNFQNDNSQRSAKKSFNQVRNQKSEGQIQIIQLQKSKISHLETQLKQIQKRNKQLQTLMVKFMK